MSLAALMRETDSWREVVEMDGETGGEIFDCLEATVMKV